MIRVAINGFGRIGRCFVRAAIKNPEITIVAVNDIGELANLAYLLKYDSVYGVSPYDIKEEKDSLIVDGNAISFLHEKDPSTLPWKNLDIDVVVESTGIFDSFEKASSHITAGAKRVVISAPVKDEAPNAATVLMGVNEQLLEHAVITSNASCTTNAASPIIAILNERFGIEKAILNTTHAYTSTQSLSDSPVKGSDFRRGRAGAHNMSPSSTGAAIAVTRAYTELVNKFDGIAVRVPVIAGSLVDVTCVLKRNTTAEEINNALEQAAHEERWQGLFTTTTEPIVSSDIIGNQHASIADLSMTRVVDGNLIKVLSWYDNEMGYTHTLIKHVVETGKYTL